MANISVAAYKTLDTLFSNERGFAKLTYSFADDGGAYSGNTYRLALANRKFLITEAILHVETAVVGSSSTITMGTTGTAGAFASAVAEGTLLDDYAVDTAAGQKIVLASAEYITMTIGTADLTAGKLNLLISYFNID